MALYTSRAAVSTFMAVVTRSSQNALTSWSSVSSPVVKVPCVSQGSSTPAPVDVAFVALVLAAVALLAVALLAVALVLVALVALC